VSDTDASPISPVSLPGELKEAMGFDLVGVVEARSYDAGAPAGRRARDFLPEAESIIVAGFRRTAPREKDAVPSREEQIEDYLISVSEARETLLRAASFMEERGHRAYPVPYRELPRFFLEGKREIALRALRALLAWPRVRQRADRFMHDRLSYIRLAVMAGLGEVGHNGLLITPDHGPGIRLMALLTDAVLEPGWPCEPGLCRPDLCGYACARACPSGAVRKEASGTDNLACLGHFLELLSGGDGLLECGRCMNACPAARPRFRTKAGSHHL